jgi:uncharacterized surface protein with fasciclin (FAS1) repeats
MKRTHIALLLTSVAFGCDKTEPLASAQVTAATATPADDPAAGTPDRFMKKDPNAPKDILDVALGSTDHTTLVTALKAADYVDVLATPGPFTVFAPTNAAFEKLPKGSVESLVRPEKKDDLRDVLKYHVAVSVYQTKDLEDGQVLAMANGKKITFHVDGGKVSVNDAKIVASVPASNGIIHIIDGVLLP